MLGLLWILIEKAYVFLSGTKTALIAEEQDLEKAECCPNQVFEKQFETSLQKSILNTFIQGNPIAVVDKNVVFLTSSNRKVENPIALPLEWSFKEGFESVQSLSPVLSIRTTIEQETVTRGNALLAVPNRILPVGRHNFIYQRVTVLEDFESKQSSFIMENLSIKSFLEQDNNTKSLIPYRAKNSKPLSIHENEMRGFQKVAQYITHYLQFSNVIKTSNYKEGYALNVPKAHKNSCKGRTFNKLSSRRNYCSYRLQQKTKFTSISMVEVGPTEDNTARGRQTTPKTLKELQKLNKKLIKCTLPLKKNECKKTFSSYKAFSNHSSGNFESLMQANDSCTNIQLMMEIKRQLRPITDQINELRKSMTEYSMINFKNKSVKSTIFTLNSLSKSIPESKSVLNLKALESHMYDRRVNDSVKVLPYSEDSFHITEPRTLSPLAQMYIKLSTL